MAIGAVYGQIAGAYFGLDQIPEKWRALITRADEIENLAMRLSLGPSNFSPARRRQAKHEALGVPAWAGGDYHRAIAQFDKILDAMGYDGSLAGRGVVQCARDILTKEAGLPVSF